MKQLKLQDTNWIIYQPDGKPAHWDLGADLRQKNSMIFRGVPQADIDAFLTEHYLDALDNILDEQDWEADFNGYTGEIEVRSRHGNLDEATVRQWMAVAMDDAVEMLLDALRDG